MAGLAALTSESSLGPVFLLYPTMNTSFLFNLASTVVTTLSSLIWQCLQFTDCTKKIKKNFDNCMYRQDLFLI